MKEKVIKFNYIFIFVALIFFGTLNKLEFATDTYCVFATPIKQYCEHFLYSGRFISAFSLACAGVLKLKPETMYVVSFCIAIISTIIAMNKLYNVFKKEFDNEICNIISVILVIINVFSIELYLFLEKGILMLSVLFCIMALEQYSKYVKENRKLLLIYSFLLMLLANFSYQGTVGIFIALSVVFIAKYGNTKNKFLKYNFFAALCYGIPALINYIIVKVLYNNQRVSGKIEFIKSFGLILKNTKDMLIDTYNILPKYFFLIIVIIMIIFVVISVIIKKDKKEIFINLLKLSYIILGVYIVTIFPQIMQSTASIGFAPRNTYAFASILGILFLYNNMIGNYKIIRILEIMILIILLFIQYISFNNIIRNRYILNYNDYNNAMSILEKVKEYEENTGIYIDSVAIYKQNGNSLSYRDLYISGDINVKATCPEWSRIDYLEFYLNRNLSVVSEDEEVYEEYFKNVNTKSFSTEHIFLRDNVMHFCLY